MSLPLSLAAACVLLVACVSGDVLTGRRCPPGESGCLALEQADSATLDAGPDFWSDAARIRPCLCDGGAIGARLDDDAACGSCSAPAAPTTPTLCAAGRYEGSFDMSYRSGPGGVCGLIAELSTAQAAGGWAFVLAGPIAEGASSYRIRQACVRAGAGATSDGRMVTPPLRMIMDGMLDCTTGLLRAELRGTYAAPSVCNLGTLKEDYFFKGTLSGRFEPLSKTFVEGQVQWSEPPVLFPPPPGGEGIWAASWLPDAGVTDLGGDCLGGLSFPEEVFADAGT